MTSWRHWRFKTFAPHIVRSFVKASLLRSDSVAFECEADMRTVDRSNQSDVNDPQETSAAQGFRSAKALFVPSLKRDIVPSILHAHDLRWEESHGNPPPTARIHIHTGRRSSCVAAGGARAAASDARHRLPRNQIT